MRTLQLIAVMILVGLMGLALAPFVVVWWLLVDSDGPVVRKERGSE